jgi:hypothetical protein
VTVLSASPPPAINETAEHGEDPRSTVDFVEDDQPVFMLSKIEFGIREPGTVGRRFKIEVQRSRSHSFGQRERKRRFAYLSGPEQCDGGELLEEGLNSSLGQPWV